MSELVVVMGGGGFIGGHLCKDLLRQGYSVRSVDIKPFDEWEQLHSDVENLQLDLQLLENCRSAVKGASRVLGLACNMGGMGFIENNKCLCMLSVLITTHALIASKEAGVNRFFYSSSACIYNINKQSDANITALKEEDAYPAMPEKGYGDEKLFSERMCECFREDFGLDTRVARFHNIYGSHGTWTGGREKAPAALCRKVAEAVLSGKHEIEIWGDGSRTRSFQYIDDCIHGINLIMESDITDPINLGTSELVTINGLVDIIEDIAGVKLKRSYKLDAPLGVMGRNSDNTMIKRLLNWEPSIPLKIGLEKTFKWIYEQVRKQHG